MSECVDMSFNVLMSVFLRIVSFRVVVIICQSFSGMKKKKKILQNMHYLIFSRVFLLGTKFFQCQLSFLRC